MNEVIRLAFRCDLFFWFFLHCKKKKKKKKKKEKDSGKAVKKNLDENNKSLIKSVAREIQKKCRLCVLESYCTSDKFL